MPAQSLPSWASIQALPSVIKPINDEDPLYLSGEETDCDSERGSDTLSREDQQLMSSFIRLHQERASKTLNWRVVPRTGARTTPLSIPAQTHKYIATSSKGWIWDQDDDDEESVRCSCCSHQSMQPRSATYPTVSAVSDLMFDLEL